MFTASNACMHEYVARRVCGVQQEAAIDLQ